MKTILIAFAGLILLNCQTHSADKPYIPTTKLPDNFYFKIAYSHNETYDSRDSTYTRLYVSGDTVVKIPFPKDIILSVYNKILENKFLDLPPDIPMDEKMPFTFPSSHDRIMVFIGGRTNKNLKISTGLSRGGTPLDTIQSKRFDNVYNIIVKALTEIKEYKQLRPSDVFYL
jgi:hypothetical protein